MVVRSPWNFMESQAQACGVVFNKPEMNEVSIRGPHILKEEYARAI